MTAFVQATLYGLLQGGLLALVAVGFSLVWGVMNVINVAHGAFVVLGAYVAFELNSTLGLDPFLGMFVAAAVLFVLGYAVQRGLINLVINAPIYLTLLLTFGLDLMLVQGMNIAFTADFRSIPTSYAGKSLALGDIRLPLGRLIAFGVAVAVTLLLVAMVTRTRTGLSIMATGMDRGAARLMGIRARHVYALTFGLAAALAGLAGAMVGTVGTFNPAGGRPATPCCRSSSRCWAAWGTCTARWSAVWSSVWSRRGRASTCPGTWVNAFAFVVLDPGAVVPAVGVGGPALLRLPRGGVMGASPADVGAPARVTTTTARPPVEARWRRPLPWAAGALVVLACLGLQTQLYTGQERTVTTIFMFVALAQAWNIIGGFTGYASFGQVVFFGLGGYTTAVVMYHWQWNFWLALVVSGLLAAAFGALIGLPLLRLKGHYFAVATLGVAEGMREVVTNLPDLTGGGAGISIPTVGPRAPTA